MTVIALVVLFVGVCAGSLLRSVRWVVLAFLVALLLLAPVGFLVVVVVGGAALLLIN